MNVVTRTEVVDVQARLSELGLTEKILHKAITQGLLARSETTLNHPPLHAGFVTWSNTVRSLREELIPQGWDRNNESNYSRVFNRLHTMAIAVATGDENTGTQATPMTKSPKGAATSQAVETNAAQFSFDGAGFDKIDFTNEDGSDVKTWLLMFCIAQNEVRCELSLPIACNGKVDGWKERLILSTIQLDPTTIDIPISPLPEMPDIEVAISRRA
jgi:hypothetical protein